MTQHTPDAPPSHAEIFKHDGRWSAHLYFTDGNYFPYWQMRWRTKARCIQAIRCTFNGPIERGEDR